MTTRKIRHTRRLAGRALACAVLLALAGASTGYAQSILGADRPLSAPTALTRGDPDRGLRFGLGVMRPSVTSDALDVDLQGGTGAGAVAITLDAGLGHFRLGYARELYRRELPPGTTYEGRPVDRLSYDADQLWVFHGFRPLFPLYLAYGLGWQLRLVRLGDGATTVATEREAGAQAGLLADWDAALPFALQLHYVRDVGGSGHLLERRAVSLHLVYFVEY